MMTPDLAQRQAEFATKHARLTTVLDMIQSDALLLTTSANVAWLTAGGRSYIVEATEGGVAALLVTRAATYLLTTNIEQRRVLDEEMAGLPIEGVANPWYAHDLLDTARRIAGPGARLASDTPADGCTLAATEVMRQRASLLPAEQERYRWVGRQTAAGLEAVARSVQPGMTEHAIAGRLAGELRGRGITPTVLLVAVDERITTYRHPLPTDAIYRQRAMLVACGRRWGLIASVTRLVQVVPLTDDLARRQAACARVDAALIGATQPGRQGRDVVAAGIAAYAAEGYADEWTLHHQGGAAGYVERDWLGTPTNSEVVQPYQAFAWNPSITGTKSEDTFLLSESATPEILTSTGDWPTMNISLAGGTMLARPVILVVDA